MNSAAAEEIQRAIDECLTAMQAALHKIIHALAHEPDTKTGD
jgi:hypothetical protein